MYRVQHKVRWPSKHIEDYMCIPPKKIVLKIWTGRQAQTMTKTQFTTSRDFVLFTVLVAMTRFLARSNLGDGGLIWLLVG